MIATLTDNEQCAVVFIIGIAAIFICARFLPFTDNWPDGTA